MRCGHRSDVDVWMSDHVFAKHRKRVGVHRQWFLVGEAGFGDGIRMRAGWKVVSRHWWLVPWELSVDVDMSWVNKFRDFLQCMKDGFPTTFSFRVHAVSHGLTCT